MTLFARVKNSIFGQHGLLLALLVTLSFGLLIPWLGFWGDEWNFIYYAARGPAGLQEIFHYDGHPQSVWIYILFFRMLGYSPWLWHINALLWRIGAVLSFWLVLRSVWPQHARQVLLVSALFAIHPILQIQTAPIPFFELWINYTLLWVSFYFSGRAVRQPERANVYLSLAVIFKIGHVLTSEYTWFLELMRPVFIWLLLPNSQPVKARLRQTMLHWLPFLLIFAVSTAWRGFFYTPLRKSFHVQEGLFSNPLLTLLAWGVNIIPDLVIVLFTSWFNLVSAENFIFNRPLNLILLGIAALSAVGCFYVFQACQSQRSEQPTSSSKHTWAWQAMLLALPSLLFGILPFYVAGYTLHQTDSDRLAFATIPGAALFLVALGELVFSSPRTRNLIWAVIIGLSITWHIRYTNEFRKVWQYQRDFFQQLTWRMPAVKPGTVFYALHPDSPLDERGITEFSFNDYRIALALNAFFEPKPQAENSQVSYWYQASLPSIDQLGPNVPYYAESYTADFSETSHQALVLLYHPQNFACLRLLGQLDAQYPIFSEEVRAVARLASSESIQASPRQNQAILQQIMGQRDSADWCYYYQTAELAAQFSDWEEIQELWQRASALGLRPSHGLEYLPFIQSSGQLGEWDLAFTLTKSAHKTSRGVASPLCSVWRQLDQSTPAHPQKDQAYLQTWQLLECAP